MGSCSWSQGISSSGETAAQSPFRIWKSLQAEGGIDAQRPSDGLQKKISSKPLVLPLRKQKYLNQSCRPGQAGGEMLFQRLRGSFQFDSLTAQHQPPPALWMVSRREFASRCARGAGKAGCGRVPWGRGAGAGGGQRSRSGAGGCLRGWEVGRWGGGVKGWRRERESERVCVCVCVVLTAPPQPPFSFLLEPLRGRGDTPSWPRLMRHFFGERELPELRAVG